MDRLYNVPCHIEFKTLDFEKFEKFYSIFDWKIVSNGLKNYCLVKFCEDFPVGGAVLKVDSLQEKSQNNPLIYIRVKDIEEGLKLIEEQGGTIAQKKLSVPGIGEWATFYDLDNNLIGLWKQL